MKLDKILKITDIFKFNEYMDDVTLLDYEQLTEAHEMIEMCPIKEGIHTSFNKENVESILNKKFPNFTIIIEDDGEIYVYGELTTKNNKVIKYGLIDDKYDELFKIIRLCGWFISSIRINNNFEIFKNDKIYSNISAVCIASLKDYPIENIPEIMYHASNSKFDKSILKNGLYPKALNKLSNHPSRIYLTDNLIIALSFKKEREKTESEPNKPVKYSIWKINMIEGINLFSDINLREVGFYTTCNIHPDKLIKII